MSFIKMAAKAPCFLSCSVARKQFRIKNIIKILNSNEQVIYYYKKTKNMDDTKNDQEMAQIEITNIEAAEYYGIEYFAVIHSNTSSTLPSDVSK